MKICKIPGCNLPTEGRGWCHKHYMRWYTRGADEADDPAAYHICGKGIPVTPEGIKERLQRKHRILENGCHEWTGYGLKSRRTDAAPRGLIVINGKRHRVHRLAWEIYRGPIPNGLWVLHKCDNGLCINPDHLYLGNHAQNMEDVVRRRRSPKIKLTEDQVRMIRASSLSSRALAKEFGVKKSSILCVRNGKTHRFVI